MASHVNSLPPELLCAIFCWLSVHDLLRAGRVCSKWHKVRQTAGYKVRKLTLVIGGVVSEGYPDFTIGRRGYGYGILNSDGSVMYPRIEYPTRDFIHYKSLDLNGLIPLTVLFPNVSTLNVALHMSSMYQLFAITILLRLWKTNLVSFKFSPVFERYRTLNAEIDLTFVLDNEIPTQFSRPLFDSINSLPTLKHLSLLFSNNHFGRVQLELPIIAQLDRFDFHSMDRTNVLLDSFRDYGINNARLRIRFEFGLNLNSQHLNQFYRLGAQLCSQFELYNDFFILHQMTVIENICANFTSLTTLHLHILEIDFAPMQNIQSLFTNLAKLTQLVHLGLFIAFEVGEDEDGEEGPGDQVPLARLPSVKSLRLFAHTHSHNNLALLNLPRTMPNLQVISVLIRGLNIVGYNRSYHCDLCGIRDELVPEHVKTCLSQVMLPLAQCTRLHSITFNSNFVCLNLNNFSLDVLSRPLIFE